MSKNLRKMAMAVAVIATLFNNCDVFAAESGKTIMQDEVRENKSTTTAAEDKYKVGKVKDKLKKGDAKKINARLDELDEKFEAQSATQRKILEMLEKIESDGVDGTSEMVSVYNPLINPSATQKIDYTQDGANSQDNSTVVFKYTPNQLYKIYCRAGYLTDLSLKKGEIKGNVESLNFNYKISGKSSVKLVAIFDDGEKTILKFDKIPKWLPSLFIRSKGKIIVANYKIRENCYVVDTVADEIELRVSAKEILKIKNKK